MLLAPINFFQFRNIFGILFLFNIFGSAITELFVNLFECLDGEVNILHAEQFNI